jgi:GNAT superfamily N-acetyltransferase
MATIALARTDAEILRCFPVMAQLRPHIPPDQFMERIRRQQREGYQLAFCEDAGAVQAVAGYRFGEFLAWGKILYVDDLVTAETARSRGFGHRLLAWLVEQAQARGCDELHLDSGVQRFGAHRFYLKERMEITAHHFALKLR